MTALPEPGQQSWRGLRVVVAGLGIAGFACADALLQREADVVVIDDNDGPEQVNKAQILEVLGATVLLGMRASCRMRICSWCRRGCHLVPQ